MATTIPADRKAEIKAYAKEAKLEARFPGRYTFFNGMTSGGKIVVRGGSDLDSNAVLDQLNDFGLFKLVDPIGNPYGFTWVFAYNPEEATTQKARRHAKQKNAYSIKRGLLDMSDEPEYQPTLPEQDRERKAFPSPCNYTPGNFRQTFRTPFEQYAHRIGHKFTVVKEYTHEELFGPGGLLEGWEEGDTMYRIRFEDGSEIVAWGEEVCD